MRAAYKVVEIVTKCHDINDAQVQRLVLEACLTAATSSVCDIHRESLLETVYAADNVMLGNHVENSNTARVVVRKLVRHVFTRYERLSEQAAAAAAAAAQAKADRLRMAREIVADITDEVLEAVGDDDPVLGYTVKDKDTESKTEDKTEDKTEENSNSSGNIRTPEMEEAYEDCLMVFRALCALSMKEPESKARESAVEKVLQNKLLMLELLYGVVENAGPRLKTDALFIDNGIKKHLCASLIHNGVSAQPRVFKASLSLFLSLMTNFRGPLRAEIGVFFANILLRVLESPNSNTEQKKMVLALLCHICKQPQSLVDLYLNYDCDLNSTDVFSRMVNDLSKIAQGSGGQRDELRTLALRCIVVILQSLVQWTDESTTERRRQSLTLARASSPETAAGATTPELGGAAGGGIIIGDEELEEFKKIKQKKQMLEDVRSKWNLNPHRAIEFLRKAGLIDDTPASLAQFLHSVDGLDKRVLGDFLGGSKQFNKDVLREYVECFDFAGMELDEALRYFLGTFLLPGEGQVVDRIMEYFGSRYFRDNNRCGRADAKDGGQERFADADAVYKLSYAIIMLATDLHNPKIKNKLTFDEWVGMVNRDLAMGMDVGYLRAVHDRIAAKKLELNSDDNDSNGGSSGNDTDGHAMISDMLSPKKQQQLFTAETSRWVDKSLQQMQAQRGRGREFLHACTAECVRPIFESIWASTVVALSILLESSDTSQVIELCLQGFKHGIHLACVFFMETQRNTFVTALEKFTLLNNLQEMKPKNIAAIKTLIGISFTEGDYLKGSWAQVLHCVSLLERLHIIATGHKPDVVYEAPSTSSSAPSAAPRTPEHRRASSMFSGSGRYLPSSPSLRSSGRRGLPFLNTELVDEQTQQQQQQQEEEENEVVPQTPFTMEMTSVEVANSRAVSLDIDNTYIDRVFADSIKLSDSAILDFVRALCDESLSEVCSSTPRIFSLQKIVEVAYYNMNRIRLVWSEMWIILQQHFIRCGCHEKSAVSMYAIDSLRQLAMKYLEKDELANYNFQKAFLKPFEVVFATTPSDVVKEFIIQCFLPLVTARTQRICSGWKTIFTVLTLAAADGNTRACTQSAFQLAANVSRACFDVVCANFFRELCATLLRFGRNVAFTDVAKGAVEELETCIDRFVVRHLAAHPGTGTGEEPDALFGESLASLNTWFPVLRGLGDVAAHPHIDVRTAALKVLFSVFNSYGAQFSRAFWELAFRGVLLPLFGSVGYSHGAVRGRIDAEWLNTTCLQALQYVVLLFSKFFDTLSFLLSDVLAMLTAFATDTNVDLANIGCTYLYQCVLDNAPRFTPAMWGQFDAVVEHFFNGHNAMLRLLHQASLGEAEVEMPREDVDVEKETKATTKNEEEEKLPEEEIIRCCKVCGKNETVAELIECPMCTGTYFCSEQCQQTDWATHRTSCLEKYKRQDVVPGASEPRSHTDVFVVLSNPQEEEEEEKGKGEGESVPLESVGLTVRKVKARSDVMRVMLKLLEELVTEQYAHFRTEDLERLADALAGTVTCASAVLSSQKAQRVLERWGVQAPLLRNEVDAVSFYVGVLFTLFTDADAAAREERRAYARPRITAVCDGLLAQRYRGEWREAAAVSAVLLVLDRLAALADADYVAFLPHYFPALTSLVADPHADVRALVQKHFTRMTPFMTFALP